MPPQRYGDLAFEKDMLMWAFGSAGSLSVEHDNSDSKKFPTFSYGFNAKGEISTSFRFNAPGGVAGDRITVYASPSADHPVRPWWWIARGPHEYAVGVAENGQLSAEYAFQHSTFTADVSTTMDPKSLPFDVKATVAAAENTDVGLKFKYDPLHGGLVDFTWAVRQAIPNHLSAFTAYYNSSRQFSAYLAGKCKIHPIYSGAFGFEENGNKISGALAMVSPCGRGIGAKVGVSVKPFAPELVLGVTTPVFDHGWKLNFSVFPLLFKQGGFSWVSASLSATN
jgi:hypothetical protein